MKSMKTNGQVLSEKEMREVKGGHIFTVHGSGEAICCPCCEASSEYLENVSKTVDGKGNVTAREYKCNVCGSIVMSE